MYIKIALLVCVVAAVAGIAAIVAKTGGHNTSPEEAQSNTVSAKVPAQQEQAGGAKREKGESRKERVEESAKSVESADGNGVESVVVPPPFKPPFAFTEIRHDFGIISPNASVSYKFGFRNSTDRAVKVTRVKVACNCMHVNIQGSIDDDREDFASGEEGVVNVTITTGSKTGEFSGTLKIFTNEDLQRPMILHVSGDVKSPAARP